MAYSQEERQDIYETICSEVAVGKSLRSICDGHKNEEFPALSTIMKWLSEDAVFSEQYVRAREEQADYIAEQILEIADAPIKTGDDEAVTRVEMERRRQQIDARKWMAGKLKPKSYGDKLQLDGDLNVKIPDDQLESRLAHLLGKAGAAGSARGEVPPEEAA